MKRLKVKAAMMLAAVMALLIPVKVLASTPPGLLDDIDVAGALSEGMTGIVGQIGAILLVILPMGLTLLGLFIAVRWGIRFIKGMTRG